jgi:uncharacterized protein
MADIRAPLLMLIGEIDTYTTVEETHAMFALAGEPKALWIVAGLGHTGLHIHAPDLYRERVLGFLAGRLRRPG